MKLEVNGIMYNIGIMQHKVKINDKELDMTANMNEDKITIDGKPYHLDFEEEGEPSLLIINGMTYLVSRSSVSHVSVGELKAPISGKVIDILATKDIAVKEGRVLVILEAMKMEIQIKSPVSKKIREIKVSKGQSVKTGDVLIIFE
jgi:biotin carboxyl carrier protein